MNFLIIDCLAIGEKKRKFSRDFIGGGPKLIAGILNQLGSPDLKLKINRAENLSSQESRTSSDMSLYDVCLISAMTMDMRSVKRIIKQWREINKEKLIIIGGSITADQDLLNKIDADISVIGEGEHKICSIIKLILKNANHLNDIFFDNLKEINGISFRRAGKIVFTKPSLKLGHFIRIPYRERFVERVKDYENYKTARVYVECVRGCSNYFRTKFELKGSRKCLEGCNICTDEDLLNNLNCPAKIPPGCGFCSTIHSFGFPKSRSAEDIISEIESLLKIGVKRIVLGGPDFLDYKRELLVKNKILTTPNVPPEPNYNELEKLIDHIVNLEPVRNGNAQIFIENVKANLCTERALEIISKIPNAVFSIGCETGSDEFAFLLGRPYAPSITLNSIKNALSRGIRIQVYFIHSLPGEKVEYIKESMNMIAELYHLGVEKITLYKYQEFPGAPFYLLKNKRDKRSNKDKELNKYRKRFIKSVINFNKMRKEAMVSREYDVLIAEQSFYNQSDAIGYIMKGGPKVLIKKLATHIGEQKRVRIKRVLSDKLVEGEIVSSNIKRDKK